eukprot:6213630-Pleurochrysis_carterae.AAC.2
MAVRMCERLCARVQLRVSVRLCAWSCVVHFPLYVRIEATYKSPGAMRGGFKRGMRERVHAKCRMHR